MTMEPELTALAERGRQQLRQRRARGILPDAVRRAMPCFLAGPLFFLVLRRFSGGELILGSGVFTVVLFLLPFGVVVALAVGRELGRVSSRRQGLAFFDQAMGLEGRLATADEFLAADSRSPFMMAAIEDARSHLDGARRFQLEDPALVWRVPAISYGYPLLSMLLLLWMSGLVGPLGLGDHTGDNTLARSASQEVVPVIRAESDAVEKPVVKPPNLERRAQGERRDAVASTGKDSTGRASKLADREKSGGGIARPGKTLEAANATGASRSSGTPSDDAQASPKAGKAKPKKHKKKSAKKSEESVAKKKSTEPAGATAGQGASRGASKNPASSDWASKDQVPASEEDLLDSEEEVDDEDSDSEARGGLQPNLRQRKPPVNRDLTVGFGNQANPDANGRGGPSDIKKTRGTASLVLGVPIPDHVKGQPNAGRTKVTQERVEPQVEEFLEIAAEGRRARNQPLGVLDKAQIGPWMRDLVKNYFLRMRLENRIPDDEQP